MVKYYQQKGGGAFMENSTLKPLAYSVPQTAQVLGVSRPKIYELVRQAGFPAFKLGGRTLVSAEGLQEWVRQQVQPTGAADKINAR